MKSLWFFSSKFRQLCFTVIWFLLELTLNELLTCLIHIKVDHRKGTILWTLLLLEYFTRLLVAIIAKEKINSKNYRKQACTNGWPPIGWFLKISTLKKCWETGEQKKSPNFRKTHPFEEKLSCWISLVPKVRPGGRDPPEDVMVSLASFSVDRGEEKTRKFCEDDGVVVFLVKKKWRRFSACDLKNL